MFDFEPFAPDKNDLDDAFIFFMMEHDEMEKEENARLEKDKGEKDNQDND